MEARCAIAALALSLIAVSGCREGGDAAPADHPSSYSIIVEPAVPDWNAPLPADLCFVASSRYEVELLTRSRRRHRLCDNLAERYLPREPRLRWPPPYLRSGNPDLAPTIVCVLARGAERIEIDYGPADTGRLDADSVCDSLVASGWKQRPATEAVWMDGPSAPRLG